MGRITKRRIGLIAVLIVGTPVLFASGKRDTDGARSSFETALRTVRNSGFMQGAGAAAAVPKWEVDLNNSFIAFTTSHYVVSRGRGVFDKFTANVSFDPNMLTSSKVDVRIDAASIDTGVQARDDHLRNPDFFDVEKFPDITFTSTRIERVSEDRLKIVGNLTMHGVTREVVLDTHYAGIVKEQNGNERTGFLAKTTLNREDFGMKYNTIMPAGLAIGTMVDIEIDLLLVKRAQARGKPAA